jgi:signal transduction histidine kinase
MKQVWVNLLDNAVKFTPDYGVIEITVADDAEHTSVSVINSGSEIPDASLGRIFQKFYQADESHSGEGNGIGLAVVQKIIELHGGDVSVESAEGKTTFTVTLPHEEVKLP